MRVIALLSLCFAAVAAVPANPERIVGGSVTTIDQYPQIAALLFSFNLVTFQQGCGSSVLNNRSVLTAAHCTFGTAVNNWRFRVGSTWASSGGVVHAVAQIINHPNYNQLNWDADIAIVRTNSAISFNNNVRPASIAGSNYNLADNQVVWAAGWGTTCSGCASSEQLRHVQVWTVNQAICSTRYSGALTANMLCAGWLDVGGRDACQLDSGGPLYHNGVVVGVTSFGQGCGLPYYPGVYARVSRFTAWVQSNA